MADMAPVAAIYVLVLLLLCCGFWLAHPLRTLRAAGQAAKTALTAMRDSAMDDLQKEKAVQRCALQMVKQSVALAVKLAVILVVAALPVWLSATLGWIDIEAFWAFALRADVLLISTALILLGLAGYRFLGKPGQ